MSKRRVLWLVLGLVAIGAAALILVQSSKTKLNTGALPDIERRDRNATLYIANDVAPPTNKWFSSLAFKQPSEPVFAYPLAFKTTTSGLEVGYPVVRAESEVVMGAFQSDLAIDFGAVNSIVRSYDDLSVEMEVRDGADKQQAQYRVMQGSPVIYGTLAPGATLKIGKSGAQITSAGNGKFRITVGERRYVAQVPHANITDTAAIQLTGYNQEVPFSLAVLPDDASNSAVLDSWLGTPTSGGEVSYRAGSEQVQTTFRLKTANGAKGLLALLSPQRKEMSERPIGSYTTILGQLDLYALERHSFTTDVAAPAEELTLDRLTVDQRAKLKLAIRDDAENLKLTKTDTYFGGKELQRAAQILQLAHQLDLKQEAADIESKLRAQLELWLEEGAGSDRLQQRFYYDTKLKGLIGLEPAFGSQDFNDHHFHYGYFIYAAATLGRYDAGFVDEYGGMVDALVRDIAADANDSYFPKLRVFDAYVGHSWASGFAPFADGNNQESSSEAVNAWYATYLWGKARGDRTVADRAQWLFAREADAAQNYYVGFDRTRPELKGYNHAIVSLLWGGKLDYATFFDASPAAKLGIQILPVTPASEYLGENPERVKENLAEVGDNPSRFVDMLTMYRSMADKQMAIQQVEQLSDEQIDDGNSRSFLLAWVYSR